MRGWERGQERLPPGYRLDTSDPATWALRRADGTAIAYFSAWSATRETVERAARDDDDRRRSKLRKVIGWSSKKIKKASTAVNS